MMIILHRNYLNRQHATETCGNLMFFCFSTKLLGLVRTTVPFSEFMKTHLLSHCNANGAIFTPLSWNYIQVKG